MRDIQYGIESRLHAVDVVPVFVFSLRGALDGSFVIILGNVDSS